MLKKIYVILAFFLLSVVGYAQQYYPYVIGFVAGEQQLHQTAADTFQVSFSGNAPVDSQWTNVNVLGAGSQVLLGFRHDLVYAENTFGQDLFVSKGFFSDYIELRWDVINYESQISNFRILRRELGGTDDYAQIANIAADSRSWQDAYAESGILYEYKLIANGIVPFEKVYVNFLEGVGFRIPYGRVSGRVTYAGGAAVPDVSIIAESDDDFSGSSIQLNGTDGYLAISPVAGNPLFKLDTAFTFQGWFKPTSLSATTSHLFKKGTQYELTHTQDQLTFSINGQSLVLNFTEKTDTFFHVTAMRTSDSLKLFVQYDGETVYKSSELLTGTTPSNDDVFSIGSSGTADYFDGKVDEVRIWHRSFSDANILVETSMYIEGTEDNLTAYYRFNEGVGDHFYDLSRKGFTFNENHGVKATSALWSTEVPNQNQLAVKGITDANGNYVISGIPYSTDGNAYHFIPVYGIHSFDPTEQLRFIGPGSTTHNGVDFTDVASFPVTGEVYYKNTNFPVEGVNLKIDGVTAVNSDGIPITTDNTGGFTIDVPIGNHFIELSKFGHGFENEGRFPAGEGNFFDFQQPYTFQTRFVDTTLVKVIGKIVGGPIQASKPKALGKTTNNLGQGNVLLGTQKNYELINMALVTDSTTTISQDVFQDFTVTSVGVTKQIIRSGALRQIEIESDPATGEFVAYLLPEKYLISSVTAGTYTYPDEFHTTLDLTNAYMMMTEKDSIVVGEIITGTGDTINDYQIDSIQYHKNLDLIYRETPSLSVTHKSGIDRFWEEEVVAKDGNTLTVVDGAGNPLTPFPIFSQRKKYDMKISVFESYINNSTGVTDKVPVTDGVVEIQNNIAINNLTQNYQITELGSVNYQFTAGLPNLIGDQTQSMTVIAYTGNSGSIQTAWPGNSGGTFKGYIFGGLPTGNNFVSSGPNKVDMIIRDPYGSGSYAFYEIGNEVSTTTSFDASHQIAGEGQFTMQFGAETKTFAGVGAGVIVETEYSNDVSVGLSSERTWLENNSTSTTITTTKQWQTSAEEDFVGARGDVFIGHSTNIVYGISNIFTIIPTANCLGCTSSNIGGYDIGIHKALRMNPKFATGFQYSLNHIQNYLIPNLQLLRDLYLQSSPFHTSLIPLGDPEYGASNTTRIEYADTTATDTTQGFTGDSYSLELRVGVTNSNWTATQDHFIDSVQFFNTQIEGWQNALARNEREKLTAEYEENLSFDAGTIYSSSITHDSTESRTETSEVMIAPSVGLSLGQDIMGFGFQMEFKETYTNTKTEEDGTETTNSVTFGFELADTDEGDYFSMDVKKPTSHTGPVFALRGGQSSCPYEDEETTVYHSPGTIISVATMQREVPQISCANPIQINVPEDNPAIFQVGMGNVSQTDDDAWFMITVDQQSNQDGALVKVDGANIANGRVLFIPASTLVNKVITIEKTVPAVNDYENIGIILHSICQFDPGNGWDDIADTVRLTARFKPVCTNVDVTSPADLWLRNTNTGTDLNVVIDNYNLAHGGFEKIQFQYKASSSSAWITDMNFYVDEVAYIADSTAGIVGVRVNAQPTINYIFDQSSLQDRNYDIRAISTCADGTTNSSEILTGIKDIKRPKVFGTPQPGDGILSPGEDVMITFDESIEAGLLLSSNFSVRGVLNGAELSHNSALYFDGVDDYASALAGVDLENKSFSVELWTKRGALTEGVLFDQAGIQLGFDATDHFYATLGANTYTTANTYTFTDKWIHFTFTYDFDNALINTYVVYDGYDGIDLSNVSTTGSFVGSGRMYIGNSGDGSLPYDGLMHDFRIWEKVIGYGESNANKFISMSGDEIGLSGFWPMNELNGEFASDLARSHSAMLFGPTWQVFPTGNARDFDGISSYLDLPTASSVIVTDEMDFTLEFWFKGAAQSNTVLFSNGKADGTEPPAAMEQIWIVGTNAAGLLYAKNNNVVLSDPSLNVMDDEWHHFALVLNRRANTSLYIDGELKTYLPSSNFGGLFSSGMTLGASRHYTNGTPYSNFFDGSLDELRIWNLARTRELLNIDLNSKLKGEEKGLLAYYPFEKYDISLILQPTLEDCDIDDNTGILTGLIATATGGGFNSNNVPSITDARPAQNLAYNWVVNDDKIIINLEEPAELMENRVIEFTVERVEDLNQNAQASPETWTAYIKQNTVTWGATDLNFSKNYGDPLSFTVDVFNSGGVDQNYTISNLPGWLTASSLTGTLTPASQITVTFTVDPLTNIGNYDFSLYLTSDFGYSEKLNINVDVIETPPNWEVDPTQFQYSMSVIGQVRIDGVFLSNENDMVAAFVNGQCRGVANIEYIAAYDMFEVFLNIYSNVLTGEQVEFRIWNASEGVIHGNVTPVVSFNNNTFLGTPAAPIIIESNNSYTRNIILIDGWKWISINLDNTYLSDVDSVFANVTSVSTDQIKGDSMFDNYGTSTGWTGSLTATGGFKFDQTYKVKHSQIDTLEISGSKIDPLNTPITLRSGWSWIGYTPQTNIPLKGAFSNHNPTGGDIIKSQYAFSMYDPIIGWIGSLDYMVPGEGYMYNSLAATQQTFVFPPTDPDKAPYQFSTEKIKVPGWNLDESKYAYNMSMIAEVKDPSILIDEHKILGAFVNGECRGICKPVLVDEQWLYFITLFANLPGEEINFQLGQANNLDRLHFVETTTFDNNKVAGNLSNPVPLTLDHAQTGFSKFNSNNRPFSIYPNPSKGGLVYIEVPGASFSQYKGASVEILDVTGKQIGVATWEEKIQALDLSSFGSGVYFIKVVSQNGNFVEKITTF